MSSRREAILRIIQGGGVVSMGGLLWGAYVNAETKDEFVLRPPGAMSNRDFLKACIKCGICVETCPYDTLKLATPEQGPLVGTPYFVPRNIPCYMCPDIPCVPHCPSGALDMKRVGNTNVKTREVIPDINQAKMGVAIIDADSCIAFWGIQCDACYRACPLLDEAITLDYERNERTGKHAFLKPVVHKDKCTGCGVCEHACVTEIASIMVFPVDKVSGKAGAYYIKGWDKNDERRLKNPENQEKNKKNSKKIQDYLNNWEELIDE